MQKYFLATKDSEFAKEMTKYIEMYEQQRVFVKQFFKDNEIEGTQYIVSGDGWVNKPFEEWNKNKITLNINPTEKDNQKFGSMLTKPKHHGLCAFKKGSKIAKEFSDLCFKEKIVVNLYQPSLRDYFQSIGYSAYTSHLLDNEDNSFYLKVESKNLKEDDIPEYMTEIKASDFYKILEERKEI
jgi:hypothetical protein